MSVRLDVEIGRSQLFLLNEMDLIDKEILGGIPESYS